jgi:uncharacterized membrane protein YjgN (DUF898 family)
LGLSGYGNTALDNHPFEYHATPIQILKGRVLVVGVFIIYTVVTAIIPATAPLFFLLL